MNKFKITLQILKDQLAVCQLEPGATLPNWVRFVSGEFISITQTLEELSIVCNQNLVPPGIKAEKNWRLIRIKGQMDFSLVGILKRVITPLSESEISIYSISTYNTDYILIKDENFERAVQMLSEEFVVEG